MDQFVVVAWYITDCDFKWITNEAAQRLAFARIMLPALVYVALFGVAAALASATSSASPSDFRVSDPALSSVVASPSSIQSWLRVASDAAAAGQPLLFKRCRCDQQLHSFGFNNVVFSYTARRLEANTYQFEELALKAITIGLHQLAVELLINSLAIDEQQEETWCDITGIHSLVIPSLLAPPPSLTRACRYRLGNAFHELKLDFHAAACYRRCIALNRKDLRFWNDLGSA